MTNYEYIKQMSVEEMGMNFHDSFDCHLCREHHRLSDNPLLKHEKCDEKCEQHLKEWLEREVDDND